MQLGYSTTPADWVIQFGTFSSVALSESRCIFVLDPSNSFPILLVHSTFLLCSLHCYIFCSKIDLFPCHQLLVRLGAFFYFLVEFSFVILECSVLFVWFYPDSISFLVFLFSPIPSALFRRVVLLVLLVSLLFSFQLNMLQRSSSVFVLLVVNFLHQFQMGIFHWSLSDSKSLLFLHLKDLCSTDLIFSFSSLFPRSKCSDYNYYHRHLHVPHFFISRARSW